MAKYTIELNHIIKMFSLEEVKSWFMDYELNDYLTDEEIRSIASLKVWNKEKLATKIINHYMFREIGFDTPALFRFYVKSKMSEIMGFYLPLIYTTTISYDILNNEDYTETLERHASSNTNLNGGSDVWNVENDTPQGEINKEDVISGKYASNITAGKSTNTSTSADNTNENYTRHIKGKRGSVTYNKLISEYRKNIINIDEQIINDLKDLFMGIY